LLWDSREHDNDEPFFLIFGTDNALNWMSEHLDWSSDGTFKGN